MYAVFVAVSHISDPRFSGNLVVWNALSGAEVARYHQRQYRAEVNHVFEVFLEFCVYIMSTGGRRLLQCKIQPFGFADMRRKRGISAVDGWKTRSKAKQRLMKAKTRAVCMFRFASFTANICVPVDYLTSTIVRSIGAWCVAVLCLSLSTFSCMVQISDRPISLVWFWVIRLQCYYRMDDVTIFFSLFLFFVFFLSFDLVLLLMLVFLFSSLCFFFSSLVSFSFCFLPLFLSNFLHKVDSPCTSLFSHAPFPLFLRCSLVCITRLGPRCNR